MPLQGAWPKKTRDDAKALPRVLPCAAEFTVLLVTQGFGAARQGGIAFALQGGERGSGIAAARSQ